MNSNNKRFKLVDLFAGAGGLSKGFEQTGCFETIGAVEINQALLKLMFITTAETETLLLDRTIVIPVTLVKSTSVNGKRAKTLILIY
nr:DNA cytosine methyltransferase [Bacillus velezensis]